MLSKQGVTDELRDNISLCILALLFNYPKETLSFMKRTDTTELVMVDLLKYYLPL